MRSTIVGERDENLNGAGNMETGNSTHVSGPAEAHLAASHSLAQNSVYVFPPDAYRLRQMTDRGTIKAG